MDKKENERKKKGRLVFLPIKESQGLFPTLHVY